MAHRSGRVGQVDAAAEVTGIKSWTLEYTVTTLNVTDFADAGESEFLPGISEWHGTFEGYRDAAPIALGTSATAIVIKLYETQTGSEFWTGDCFITAIRASVDHDGIVTYSYDFQGTGTLTVPA